MYVSAMPDEIKQDHEFLSPDGPCFAVSFYDRGAQISMTFDEVTALRTMIALQDGIKKANALEQDARYTK